jgi:protein-S-isoprenylcysteine O-methyltransferase Ste14
MAGTALTLAALLALTLPVSAGALLYARRDYRERGRLSVPGLFLLCVMLLMPNLVLHYATSYALPTTILDYIGVAIGVAGLGLCLGSIAFFRSPLKVLCLRTGELTLTGPYRWSRNPQYVGWVLFLAGFALNYWSLWCLGALAVVAVSLHLLVLIEEEHLLRTFGEPYAGYCRKVSRYIG